MSVLPGVMSGQESTFWLKSSIWWNWRQIQCHKRMAETVDQAKPNFDIIRIWDQNMTVIFDASLSLYWLIDKRASILLNHNLIISTFHKSPSNNRDRHTFYYYSGWMLVVLSSGICRLSSTTLCCGQMAIYYCIL